MIEETLREYKETLIIKDSFERREKLIAYIKLCIDVEMYEAINSIQSWKLWKKDKSNDMKLVTEEIADALLFMLNVLDPISLLEVMNRINELSYMETGSLTSAFTKRYEEVKSFLNDEEQKYIGDNIKGILVDKIRFNLSRVDHI